jgi:hypothetical protein
MPSVPRPLVRAALVATVAAAAVLLAGCTSTPQPATTSGPPSCGGKVKEVLLGDDSATDVVPFDAGDSPKVFNLPTSPAPTCAYRTVTSAQGAAKTTTHRSYLYIGITATDAQKIIAALATTAGQAPWTGEYSNVPAAGSTPAPGQLQTVSWRYNAGGGAGDDQGSMAYAYTAPLNPGLVTQAGLRGTKNILRIETELSSPAK